MSDDCIGCMPPDTDGYTVDPVFTEGQNSGEPYAELVTHSRDDIQPPALSLEEHGIPIVVLLVALCVAIKAFRNGFDKEKEEPVPGIINLVEDLNHMAFQMLKVSFPIMCANIETKGRWKKWIYRGDVAYYTLVGKRIKEERERQKMTQEELANSVRTSRGTIACIENGNQKMYVHQMVAICNQLNIHPITLLSV